MSPRSITFIGILTIGALSSWYLARSNQTAYDDELLYDPLHRGYYLKKARILGTGETAVCSTRSRQNMPNNWKTTR